jgi:predicted ArsR family transcriptional regulator
MADVMRTLSEPQLAHLEHKFAESNEDLADRFLQRKPEARRKAQLERAVDRIEMLYGDLGDAQLEQVAKLALETPFDPERWLAERRSRQQDVLQTLRRLSASQASTEQADAALRALIQRMRVSPHDDYRAYQLRLIRFNCGFAAQVHNLTTPAQRAAAARRLKGWEDDARALAAQGR